jgi:hypothetical protein
VSIQRAYLIVENSKRKARLKPWGQQHSKTCLPQIAKRQPSRPTYPQFAPQKAGFSVDTVDKSVERDYY